MQLMVISSQSLAYPDTQLAPRGPHAIDGDFVPVVVFRFRSFFDLVVPDADPVPDSPRLSVVGYSWVSAASGSA